MVTLHEVITFLDRKSGSAGMPRPSSYAVFCLKKKTCHTGTMKNGTCQSHGGNATAATKGNKNFFIHATATTKIYTLSLHDALPISDAQRLERMTSKGRLSAS